MRKIKEAMVLVVAMGLILSSMVVFAAEGDSNSSSTPVSYTSVSDNSVSSSPSSLISEERAVRAEARRETARMEAEAVSEGFENAAQMQRAQAENKSAGEYYNNAVVSTPGIENATSVSQGGNLIVNGKVTNMTAEVSKVSKAYVDSVRATQEGTVLNVVNISFPAKEATITFYMPGVEDGANIAAVQYVGGAWVDVEVKEVRADHVVLDLKRNGVVAFLAK